MKPLNNSTTNSLSEPSAPSLHKTDDERKLQIDGIAVSTEVKAEKDTFTFLEEEEEEEFDAKEYLQHLSEMFNGKQQYMMEMIEILLQQIPVTSQKMEAAIEVENWEEVFFQSHRIKSTFRIAGLKKLVNVCLAIEGRTRIIAPEELHLVPDFFLQFKELSLVEIPNLEAALQYLKESQSHISNEVKIDATIVETTSISTETEDSDFTLLLP